MTIFAIRGVIIVNAVSRGRPQAVSRNVDQRRSGIGARSKAVVHAVTIRIDLMYGHCRANPLAAVVQRNIHTVSTIPAVGVQVSVRIAISIRPVREEVFVKVAGENNVAHQGRIAEVNSGLHCVIRIRMRNRRNRHVISSIRIAVIARVVGVTEPTGSPFI